MSNSIEYKRIQCLLRHIQHVEDNCRVIANSLMLNDEFDFARELLRNGHIHDASKFDGIEWEHLCDKSDPLFFTALKHHHSVNKHHPEYWGSIHDMPRVYVAEMVADWQGRSSELQGKGLIQWIEEDALNRYKFHQSDKVYTEVYDFINLLLEPAFT